MPKPKKIIDPTPHYYFCRYTPHDDGLSYKELLSLIEKSPHPWCIVQETKSKAGKRCDLHYHIWVKLSHTQKNDLKKILDPNKRGNGKLSMPMADTQDAKDAQKLICYVKKHPSSDFKYAGIPESVIAKGTAEAEEKFREKKEKLSIYKRLQAEVYPKVKDMRSEFPHESKEKAKKVIQIVGEFFKHYEGMSTQFMIKGYIETFCYKYIDGYRRAVLIRSYNDICSLIDMEGYQNSIKIDLLDD